MQTGARSKKEIQRSSNGTKQILHTPNKKPARRRSQRIAILLHDLEFELYFSIKISMNK